MREWMGEGEQGNKEGEEGERGVQPHMAPPCLTWSHLPGNVALWKNIRLMTIYDGI